MDAKTSIEWRIVIAIILLARKHKIDLAQSDPKKLKSLGYSLANTFREDGRELFHEVCKLTNSYDTGYTNLVFTNCLQSCRRISFATFVYSAAKQNITRFEYFFCYKDDHIDILNVNLTLSNI